MTNAAPISASQMLAHYQQAERDVLLYGKASTSDGRSLTTADLPQIIAGRQEWEARVMAEARAASGRGSISVRTAVFRD